ncbi:hypothetical protein QBZ16_002697 [Prototheca wickerhamii]|uniref:Cullin family profile domain-containing protein n=1 Tax=Prototheca wickerhamii TaxID=3111 RepID=A0AAD9MIX2_PROWI|nr:hypothetical protein QBZ16_002697 [Prototheca wickerhamii]
MWVDLWNCMYRDRIVFLYKPLDDQLANQLVATLLYLDGENQKDIFLYINCSGGDVSSALALHDTMRYIQSDVGAVAFGGAYGMAGFLLAVAKKASRLPGKRVALSNTRIMLHHPSGVARGQAADISRESRELLRTRDYLNAVVAEATGKDPETVAHDFRHGRYFNTREAQEYGIIDIIIIPRKEERRRRMREEAEAARLAEGVTDVLEEEGKEPGDEGASAEAGGAAPGETSEEGAPGEESSFTEPGEPGEEDVPGPADPEEHSLDGESTSGSGNAYQMTVYKYGDVLYKGFIRTETEYLESVASRLERVSEDALLPAVKDEWERHVKSVSLIRAFLMYLDRVHIANHKELTPLYQLGLNLWRDLVACSPRLGPRLRALVLEAVARDRAGGLADVALLRALTGMYSDLGAGVYAAEVERPLLEQAERFYAAEAQQLLREGDAPAYLLAAEGWLDKERARAGLPGADDRAGAGGGGGPRAGGRAAGRAAAPARVGPGRARARAAGRGLEEVQAALGAHVRETGRALVTDPERAKDPVAFVGALLAAREEYETLVRRAFGEDKRFVYALNRAFEHFLNLNPRAPEYLSLYLDDKLRRGLKETSEDALEASLDAAILLFRSLQDKDVFERYYKQHLARRLLVGRGADADEAERALLAKLRAECGYQFTSKLESMFTDVRTSRDAAARFKQWLARERGGAPLGFDLNVQLEEATAAFTRFYTETHSGRRLAWQPAMGTAEMRVEFGGRRHELTCNTWQMMVLLLFNDAERLTARELREATRIPDADLRRVLQSLACVKGKNVLKKEPMSKEVADTDVFSINENFQSRLYKIKIGMRESEQNKEVTRERVEEDRKPQIEAAIVRIMKVIKKRIESLIERDFIERDASDRSMYRYVA